MRRPESAIAFENLLELLASFRIIALGHKREGVIIPDDQSQRIERQRQPKLILRFVKFVHRQEVVKTVEVVSVGVIGIEFDGAAKFRFGFVPLPGAGQRIGARHVRLRTCAVERHRFLGSFAREDQRLGRRDQPAVARRDDVAGGKTGPGQGVIRIGGDGLAEHVHALQNSGIGAAVELLLGFEVEAICVWIAGAGVAHFGLGVGARMNLQLAGDVTSDVALHLGDVRHFAFVMRAPHFRAVRGVDEIGLHGDRVAMLGDAAHQDRADVELFADFLRIVFAIFETEDGAAGHHFYVWQLRERANQAFGEAVAEIFVVGVGGGVDERQHGDRGDFLFRRAAVEEIVVGAGERDYGDGRNAKPRFFRRACCWRVERAGARGSRGGGNICRRRGARDSGRGGRCGAERHGRGRAGLKSDGAGYRWRSRIGYARGTAGIQFPLQAREVGANIRGGLITECAVVFEGFVDDAFESRGNFGIEADGGHERAIENRFENDGGSFATKRKRAGSHFVDHGAKGKKIGAAVEILAANLFGRHIRDGAHGAAGTGKVLGGLGRLGSVELRARSGRAAFGKRDFGQAEIENLGVTALGHKNICGLDVAMDDAFGMRSFERVGDFDGKGEQVVHLDRTPIDAVLERLAVEKFHGDEGLAVLLADVVNGADVRMIQRGGGLGFALETGQGLRVAGDVLREKFQRDETAQARVFRFVHHAHSSAAESFDDPVMRNGLA